MTRILVLSDDGLPTGYGRISSEVNTRLSKRGYEVFAASLQYDGLLPVTYDGTPLPYHVASLAGKQNWIEPTLALIQAVKPDIIHVIQDFPYAVMLRNAPIDWSLYKFMITTPVDGAPIHPDWLRTMRLADAGLSISEFGVNAFRQAGIEVGLCRPGVNLDKFYKLPDEQRLTIRKALNIEPDAFVLGIMGMNQGRKSIPQMMKAFFDFAIDKPNARILMDMEAVSPAGWDLESLCQQYGWEREKIIFRADCIRAGVFDIRDRFNVCDVHSVLSFREGFGLPLVEAMACGVVSAASDWCSGTEIVGEGRGLLIKTVDYFMPSTWGGALDKLPDSVDFKNQLQYIYTHPEERKAMALRGMEWARSYTWDMATDNVVKAVNKALSTPLASQPVSKPAPVVTAQTAIAPAVPDGVVKQVELIET